MGRRPFDYEAYDDLVGLGYGQVEIAARYGIQLASLQRAIYRRPAAQPRLMQTPPQRSTP